MKLRFLDVAEAEQAEAAAHYESQRVGAEFVEELDRTAGRILEFPNAWSSASRNTRACQMKRFPYSIIYRDYGEEIVVVALQHHRRDPRRWEDRRFK